MPTGQSLHLNSTSSADDDDSPQNHVDRRSGSGSQEKISLDMFPSLDLPEHDATLGSDPTTAHTSQGSNSQQASSLSPPSSQPQSHMSHMSHMPQSTQGIIYDILLTIGYYLPLSRVSRSSIIGSSSTGCIWQHIDKCNPLCYISALTTIDPLRICSYLLSFIVFSPTTAVFLSIASTLLAILLCFGWRTLLFLFVIGVCLLSITISIIYALYTRVNVRSLIRSHLPHVVLKFFLDHQASIRRVFSLSLLDINTIELSGGSFTDIIALLFFNMDAENRALILRRLPKNAQNLLTTTLSDIIPTWITDWALHLADTAQGSYHSHSHLDSGTLLQQCQHQNLVDHPTLIDEPVSSATGYLTPRPKPLAGRPKQVRWMQDQDEQHAQVASRYGSPQQFQQPISTNPKYARLLLQLNKNEFTTPFKQRLISIINAPAKAGPMFNASKPKAFAIASYYGLHLKENMIRYFKTEFPRLHEVMQRLDAMVHSEVLLKVIGSFMGLQSNSDLGVDGDVDSSRCPSPSSIRPLVLDLHASPSSLPTTHTDTDNVVQTLSLDASIASLDWVDQVVVLPVCRSLSAPPCCLQIDSGAVSLPSSLQSLDSNQARDMSSPSCFTHAFLWSLYQSAAACHCVHDLHQHSLGPGAPQDPNSGDHYQGGPRPTRVLKVPLRALPLLTSSLVLAHPVPDVAPLDCFHSTDRTESSSQSCQISDGHSKPAALALSSLPDALKHLENDIIALLQPHTSFFLRAPRLSMHNGGTPDPKLYFSLPHPLLSQLLVLSVQHQLRVLYIVFIILDAYHRARLQGLSCTAAGNMEESVTQLQTQYYLFHRAFQHIADDQDFSQIISRPFRQYLGGLRQYVDPGPASDLDLSLGKGPDATDTDTEPQPLPSPQAAPFLREHLRHDSTHTRHLDDSSLHVVCSSCYSTLVLQPLLYLLHSFTSGIYRTEDIRSIITGIIDQNVVSSSPLIVLRPDQDHTLPTTPPSPLQTTPLQPRASVNGQSGYAAHTSPLFPYKTHPVHGTTPDPQPLPTHPMFNSNPHSFQSQSFQEAPGSSLKIASLLTQPSVEVATEASRSAISRITAGWPIFTVIKTLVSVSAALWVFRILINPRLRIIALRRIRSRSIQAADTLLHVGTALALSRSIILRGQQQAAQESEAPTRGHPDRSPCGPQHAPSDDSDDPAAQHPCYSDKPHAPEDAQEPFWSSFTRFAQGPFIMHSPGCPVYGACSSSQPAEDAAVDENQPPWSTLRGTLQVGSDPAAQGSGVQQPVRFTCRHCHSTPQGLESESAAENLSQLPPMELFTLLLLRIGFLDDSQNADHKEGIERIETTTDDAQHITLPSWCEGVHSHSSISSLLQYYHRLTQAMSTTTAAAAQTKKYKPHRSMFSASRRIVSHMASAVNPLNLFQKVTRRLSSAARAADIMALLFLAMWLTRNGMLPDWFTKR